jgi:hypothetical protein
LTDAELSARFAAAQPAPPASACPAPEALLALARGAVADTERWALADHLSRCAACRREFALLQLAGANESDAHVTTGDETRVAAPARRHALWWRAPAPLAIAATLLVTVGLGVSLRERWQTPAATSDDVLRGGPASAATADDASALRTLGPDDPLTWPAVPDAVAYDVELLDATGRLVAECRAQDTTCVPSPPADTPDALRTLTAGQRLELVVRARGLDGVEQTSAPIALKWR